MSDEPRTATFDIVRSTGSSDHDRVVVEEPLEIRIGDRPVSVTLRTPGEDFDLAAGFLFTESILRSPDDIDSIRHWGSPNVVRVGLREGTAIDLQRLQRHFYSTSSCGVCGKTSIDALRAQTFPLENDVTIAADEVHRLVTALREQQSTFEATGAIHAAATFRRDGPLVCAREDIGRHNAVDKVAGSMLLNRASADVLVVSSRTSFEIVQKCVVMRIPILAAVGAPSSLAIELARDFGLTLLGFVRDGRFNIYTHPERIA